MNCILTYLLFPLERQKEADIRCWLDGGHFPNYINRANGKLLVFNINIKLIERFVTHFGITSWEVGQDAWPDGYDDLCKIVNKVIRENAGCYFRFSGETSGYVYTENFSDIYDLLSAAYLHDGYGAWRLRYYLSAHCMGHATENLRDSGYLGDLTMPRAVEHLRRIVQKELDMVDRDLMLSDDTESKPVARVWADRNPVTGVFGRLYVGWFSKSFDHSLSTINRERFSKVTPIMNRHLQKLGIPRNTELSTVIDRFIVQTGYLKVNCPEWSLSVPDMNYGIVSTAVIPYMEWEDPKKVLPFNSIPYAIDRKNHKILIFNAHCCRKELLEKLQKKSILRKVFFTCRRLPEYADLYEYMERRIKHNLQGTSIRMTTVQNICLYTGMCAYYSRLRCFSGLMNLDPYNLHANENRNINNECN